MGTEVFDDMGTILGPAPPQPISSRWGRAAALEEFDDAYSEEELRLAKIKFMSEVAH